ncbi:MAG TPA: TIGR02466 family protein, partial [Bdellovibrionales bacterium]|nr:TIGR02466 family protein [Bdellovibrionales bacterium]
MASKIEMVFPSYIARGSVSGFARLNRELAREIETLEEIDDHGRDWSRENYQGGYSSYSSLTRLHQTSPNFAELETKLRPHVARFVKALKWDLRGRKLTMTTCWANSMGRGTHHTMHTHPLCVLSGVYYVTAPAGSSPLKLEDPRLGLLMAAPPRKAS